MFHLCLFYLSILFFLIVSEVLICGNYVKKRAAKPEFVMQDVVKIKWVDSVPINRDVYFFDNL